MVCSKTIRSHLHTLKWDTVMLNAITLAHLVGLILLIRHEDFETWLYTVCCVWVQIRVNCFHRKSAWSSVLFGPICIKLESLFIGGLLRFLITSGSYVNCLLCLQLGHVVRQFSEEHIIQNVNVPTSSWKNAAFSLLARHYPLSDPNCSRRCSWLVLSEHVRMCMHT